MLSTLRGGTVVVLGAVATLSLSPGSALADPPVVPAANDIVGTGSNTTQYLTDTLARGYTGPGGSRLASFNAIKPGTEADPVVNDPTRSSARGWTSPGRPARPPAPRRRTRCRSSRSRRTG